MRLRPNRAVVTFCQTASPAGEQRLKRCGRGPWPMWPRNGAQERSPLADDGP